MEHARHDPAMLALLKAHGGVVPDDERNHLDRLIEANDLEALEREILANPRLASSTMRHGATVSSPGPRTRATMR